MKDAKRAISMKSDIFGGGAVSYSYRCFWAFTLAEMMVVLLILSIVLAAMAPIMTTRIKRDTAGNGLSGSSSVWQWATNKVDAYFGSEENPTAMIGQTEVVSEDPPARLIINTSDTRPNHILFKKGNDVLGRLSLFSNEILLGRDNTITEGADNFISLGHNTTVGDSSLTIGNGASASTLGIAIGNSATLVNEGVVIGNNAAVNEKQISGILKNIPDKSIVIGNNANIEGAKYGIAIGEGANISRDAYITSGGDGEGAIAIGRAAAVYHEGDAVSYGYTDHLGAIAIGRDASAGEVTADATKTGEYRGGAGYSSIAIGSEAKAVGGGIAIGSSMIGYQYDEYKPNVKSERSTEAQNFSIAIGIGAYAGRDSVYSSDSVAIGTDAYAEHRSVAIGRKSNASGEGSMALGRESKATADYSTAIGSGAKATADYSTAIGSGANATALKSTAIGYGAVADHERQIVLGTSADTVYIPGRLIVGLQSYFGSSIPCGGAAVAGTFGISQGFIEALSEDIYMVKSSVRHDLGNLEGGNYDSILYYMNNPYNPSDRRLKYVGKEFTSGLDKIRQLKAFNYTFKKDAKKTPRVGVIAQDLQKIFPNAVEKGSDGFLTIRMEDMFYALVNAVKELDAKVTAMVSDFAKQKEQLFSAQKDINTLKKENKELKQALNKANNDNKKLEARLNALEAKIK